MPRAALEYIEYMRYRDYKIFRSGKYYHLFNRGNHKQDVFRDEQDYEVFRARLMQALGLPTFGRSRLKPFPNSFSVLSYCLMPNHFHILIRQLIDVSIEKLMSRVLTSYVMYFNIKYRQVGHLFQGRYKAKAVESDEYAKYLSAYIHNNPSRLEYKFSSFSEIFRMDPTGICDVKALLAWFDDDPKKYRKFVEAYRSNPKIDFAYFDDG